ncbi:hypothetical protein EKD04_017455 [Chloroflexales bacterium ZM16-3]|nr:hypothetical protein [Chloroflexales bacterium ZM16-3]
MNTTPQPRTPLFDPRIAVAIADLSDDEVADVLRQMCRAWTPDEDPEDMVAGNPANTRGLVIEVAGMNVSYGGEAEFETLNGFIAQATAHRAAA